MGFFKKPKSIVNNDLAAFAETENQPKHWSFTDEEDNADTIDCAASVTTTVLNETRTPSIFQVGDEASTHTTAHTRITEEMSVSNDTASQAEIESSVAAALAAVGIQKDPKKTFFIELGKYNHLKSKFPKKTETLDKDTIADVRRMLAERDRRINDRQFPIALENACRTAKTKYQDPDLVTGAYQFMTFSTIQKFPHAMGRLIIEDILELHNEVCRNC